jgi:hypothetical protein
MLSCDLLTCCHYVCRWWNFVYVHRLPIGSMSIMYVHQQPSNCLTFLFNSISWFFCFRYSSQLVLIRIISQQLGAVFFQLFSFRLTKAVKYSSLLIPSVFWFTVDNNASLIHLCRLYVRYCSSKNEFCFFFFLQTHEYIWWANRIKQDNVSKTDCVYCIFLSSLIPTSIM